MAGARTPASTNDALAILARESSDLGVHLSTEAIARFAAYIDTLLFWRRRLSLTTASTPESLVYDHILDSLHVARFIAPAFRVADIGSGAGFPGIPLAIGCERASFVLIESRRKRANFLREVVRNARLTNAMVHEGRAEDLDASAAGFDVATARALGPLNEFLRVSAPLLRSGGLAIAMKGPSGVDELREDSSAYAEPGVVHYTLREGRARLLVVWRRR